MGGVVISGIHTSTHSTVCLPFYIQRHVMSLTAFKDNQHNRKVEISHSPVHSLRVVKGIFVTPDRPFFFPMKCEMANFFLVNRDFHSSREA